MCSHEPKKEVVAAVELLKLRKVCPCFVFTLDRVHLTAYMNVRTVPRTQVPACMHALYPVMCLLQITHVLEYPYPSSLLTI